MRLTTAPHSDETVVTTSQALQTLRAALLDRELPWIAKGIAAYVAAAAPREVQVNELLELCGPADMPSDVMHALAQLRHRGYMLLASRS